MSSSEDDGFVDVEEFTRLTKTINDVKYIVHYAFQFDRVCRSEDSVLDFVAGATQLMDDNCPPKLLWALLLHFIRRPTGQKNLKTVFSLLVSDPEVQKKIGISIREEALNFIEKNALTYNDESVYNAAGPLFSMPFADDVKHLDRDEIDRIFQSNRMPNVLQHQITGVRGSRIEEICTVMGKDNVNSLRRLLDLYDIDPIEKLDLVSIYMNDLFSYMIGCRMVYNKDTSIRWHFMIIA